MLRSWKGDSSAFARAAQYSTFRIQERLASLEIEGKDNMRDDNLLDMFICGHISSFSALNDKKLSSRLLINVAAGGDTTASTLTAIIYFVLKEPNVKANLCRELREANLSTPVTFKQARELPYLNAVINEGMRLRPAIGLLLERVVPETGLILNDGRFIPKGNKVGINPYVIHQNEDIFGQFPEAFKPERWLRDETEEEPSYKQRLGRMTQSTLTFGYGTRICIGRHISSLEIYKIIATLFHLYDVSEYGHFVISGKLTFLDSTVRSKTEQQSSKFLASGHR
jgi:cytochrome P450